MKSRWFLAISAAAVALLIQFTPVSALGGAGQEPDTAGETVRKIKMLPLDEKDTHTYGWVRISADALTMGANHLPPENFYTVYFETGADKQTLGEGPALRTSAVGEAEYTLRLTEPLGAKWSKIVLYQHTDGKEDLSGEMKPVMEAKLR